MTFDWPLTGANRVANPEAAAPGFLAAVLLLLLLPRMSVAQASGVDAPHFSVQRGYHETPIDVALSSESPGATIRYTTDGSEPSPSHGTLYAQPVRIERTTALRAVAYSNDGQISKTETHTYLFPADVLEQPQWPEGFPRQWGSASVDYEMDPNYPLSAGALMQSLEALPTVSIVTTVNDLFGSDGIYPNGGRNTGNRWEHEASVEFISTGGRDDFQVNAGVQPRSHGPRESQKRGFKIDFKGEYGPGRLDEDVFDDVAVGGRSAVGDFNSLILRSGFMENYSGANYNMDRMIYVRDPLTRNAQILVSGYGTRNRFVHLFLNGLYWGIYNLTESIDTDFLTDYFGGREADWFIAKSNADSEDEGELVSGDPARYRQLREMVGHRRVGGDWTCSPTRDFSDPNVYAQVAELIDPVDFADYMVVQNFHAVGDWPNNNWVFVQKNGPDPEPGRFFAWDAEKTWLENDDRQSHEHAWYSPYLTPDEQYDFGNDAVPSCIWQAMIENEAFRVLFGDRVYRHLYGNGALTNERSASRFDSLTSMLRIPVQADQMRWGDNSGRGRRPGYMYTLQDYDREVARVRQNIAQNVAEFTNAFRLHHLYPYVDPPDFSREGGAIAGGFVLEVTNPNDAGTVHYTTDGTDPRRPDGSVAPAARASPARVEVPLHGNSRVQARVRVDSRWSAVHTADFYIPGDVAGLKITEIMYHPSAAGEVDGDDFEFIEMQNTSSRPLRLDGLTFSDGIQYDFPDATLQPGAFFVLVADVPAFESRYGFAPDDRYLRRLSNAGERLALEDGAGSLVFEVEYDDAEPWPVDADGAGYSLVLVDPATSEAPFDFSRWQLSATPDGSPGRADGAVTDLADPSLASAPYDLEPVFPNPFSSEARVTFMVRDSSHVALCLYDVLGRRLRVLYEGVPLPGRPISAAIDAAGLAGGMYFVRLQTPGGQTTRVVHLVR